jgi:hypothetical protein
MEFHKFPSIMIIYIFVFAVVYSVCASQFTGIVSFTDALIYSVLTTIGSNYDKVQPITGVAKIISMTHSLISFTSLYSTVMFQEKIYIRFLLINLGILTGILAVMKSMNIPIGINSIYDSVRNHCLISFPNEKSQKMKVLSLIHIFIVTLVIFNFNNGFFKGLSNPIFGPKLKMMNSYAKVL